MIDQALTYITIIGLGFGAIALVVAMGRHIELPAWGSQISFWRAFIQPPAVPIGIVVLGLLLADTVSNTKSNDCEESREERLASIDLDERDGSLSRLESERLQRSTMRVSVQCEADAKVSGQSAGLAFVVVLLIAYGSGRSDALAKRRR